LYCGTGFDFGFGLDFGAYAGATSRAAAGGFASVPTSTSAISAKSARSSFA
jgi:hypothetical protein